MEKSKLLFVDTNILFSSLTNPKGIVGYAFFDKILPNYEIITSTYVIEELEDVLRRKLHHKEFRWAQKVLNERILPYITLVETPKEEHLWEELIEDPKDAPILRAALAEEANLLTGDNDFFRIRDEIEEIRIMNIDELLEEIENN